MIEPIDHKSERNQLTLVISAIVGDEEALENQRENRINPRESKINNRIEIGWNENTSLPSNEMLSRTKMTIQTLFVHIQYYSPPTIHSPDI